MASYEARKRAWTKYNRSEKKRLANERYRKSHKEQCNQYSLNWQRKNKDRVNGLARKRNATSKGKALTKANHKRYAEKNRIKQLAKDAIHNALKAGKIEKLNCEKCGFIIAEGHHPDYTKPLCIVWLCKKCHCELHRILLRSAKK